MLLTETEERLISTAEEPAAKGLAAPIVPAQEIDRAAEPVVSPATGRAVVLAPIVLVAEPAIVLEAAPATDLVAAPVPIVRAAEPVLTVRAAEQALDLPAGRAAAAIELATAPYLQHQEAAVTTPSAAAVAAAIADSQPAPAAAVEEKAWEAAG